MCFIHLSAIRWRMRREGGAIINQSINKQIQIKKVIQKDKGHRRLSRSLKRIMSFLYSSPWRLIVTNSMSISTSHPPSQSSLLHSKTSTLVRILPLHPSPLPRTLTWQAQDQEKEMRGKFGRKTHSTAKTDAEGGKIPRSPDKEEPKENQERLKKMTGRKTRNKTWGKYKNVTNVERQEEKIKSALKLEKKKWRKEEELQKKGRDRRNERGRHGSERGREKEIKKISEKRRARQRQTHTGYKWRRK